MNQVVRLGDRVVRQGVLAIVLSAVCVPSCVVMGQQQVPDAPTPQQPDSLGKLTSGMTPGKGAQEAPADQGPNPPPTPASGSQPASPPFAARGRATRGAGSVSVGRTVPAKKATSPPERAGRTLASKRGAS